MAQAQSHEPTPEPRLRERAQGPDGQAQPDGPRGRQEPDPHAPRGAAEQSWAYRIAGWVVPEHYPAGVVYGLITVGALLAAESGLKDTYPETIGSAIVAMTLYWFAHAYADVLGLRLAEQRRVSWAELWHTFVQDWSIVRGAALPLLALVVAWAAGASQTTAVTLGVWAVVASLIAFELAAGVRSKSKPIELAFDVSAGTALGLGILVLRALLH
ncbi:MAG: hypothetical protein WB998_10385 [Solirubrobacteraceae bacterium]